MKISNIAFIIISSLVLFSSPSLARGGGTRGTWGTTGSWGNTGSGGWGNSPAGLDNSNYSGNPGPPGGAPSSGTPIGGTTDPLRDYYQQQEQAKLNALQAESYRQQSQQTMQQQVQLLQQQQAMRSLSVPQTQYSPGFGGFTTSSQYGSQSNIFGSLPPARTSVQLTTVQKVDAANAVRDNFHGSGIFAPTWWGQYKNAWFNTAWQSDWVWRNPDWNTLARFWAVPAKTLDEYDFGENINIAGGVVYFGNQPAMKLADFYAQAQTLSIKGNIVHQTAVAPPAADDWQPLGVFSLTHDQQKFSTTLLQLAVNRQGLIRGNCYNIVSGQLDTVSGAIDKSNSRASFIIGGNHGIVLDSGLANLLSAQSPILVHIDKNQVEQMNMVRLRQAKI